MGVAEAEERRDVHDAVLLNAGKRKERQMKNATGNGIGLCTLLTVLFTALKLCRQIDWSWRRFDELRRLCAERCDREGDAEGAAAWRDESGVKLIPVEVEIPDGIELMNIDCAASGEGGAE